MARGGRLTSYEVLRRGGQIEGRTSPVAKDRDVKKGFAALMQNRQTREMLDGLQDLFGCVLHARPARLRGVVRRASFVVRRAGRAPCALGLIASRRPRRSFDSDQSGCIDREELGGLLLAMGQRKSEPEASCPHAARAACWCSAPRRRVLYVVTIRTRMFSVTRGAHRSTASST